MPKEKYTKITKFIPPHSSGKKNNQPEVYFSQILQEQSFPKRGCNFC